MPRIQTHHINYKENPEGEWTVTLPAHLHKVITIMCGSKTTMARYVDYENFFFAFVKELSRMRRELDQRDSETT